MIKHPVALDILFGLIISFQFLWSLLLTPSPIQDSLKLSTFLRTVVVPIFAPLASFVTHVKR